MTINYNGVQTGEGDHSSEATCERQMEDELIPKLSTNALYNTER